MVRTRAESVQTPSFLRDLLAKSAGLTQEMACNGSKPPLYICEGLWRIGTKREMASTISYNQFWCLTIITNLMD
jgi:hypothetical protein